MLIRSSSFLPFYLFIYVCLCVCAQPHACACVLLYALKLYLWSIKVIHLIGIRDLKEYEGFGKCTAGKNSTFYIHSTIMKLLMIIKMLLLLVINKVFIPIGNCSSFQRNKILCKNHHFEFIPAAYLYLNDITSAKNIKYNNIHSQ